MPAACLTTLTKPTTGHWALPPRPTALPEGAQYLSLICGSHPTLAYDVIVTRADSPSGAGLQIMFSAATLAAFITEGQTSFTNNVVNNTINPAITARGFAAIPAGLRVKWQVVNFIAQQIAPGADIRTVNP